MNLFSDVFKASWRHDRVADEKNVRLRIAEWAESVVVFLAGRIEETQSVWLASNHYRYRVVVKYLSKHNKREIKTAAKILQ